MILNTSSKQSKRLFNLYIQLGEELGVSLGRLGQLPRAEKPL